jgi:hypothetical protein
MAEERMKEKGIERADRNFSKGFAQESLRCRSVPPVNLGELGKK